MGQCLHDTYRGGGRTRGGGENTHHCCRIWTSSVLVKLARVYHVHSTPERLNWDELITNLQRGMFSVLPPWQCVVYLFISKKANVTTTIGLMKPHVYDVTCFHSSMNTFIQALKVSSKIHKFWECL